MRKLVKLTRDEIAKNIIAEGVYDGYYSSVCTQYYNAFGLRFRIKYSPTQWQCCLNRAIR